MNLTEETLEAIDRCLNAFEDVKKKPDNQRKLKKLFLSLSEFDYKTEHDIILDNLIKTFLEGAYITEQVPSIERTALNSPRIRKVQNIKFWCKALLNHHYVHVQKRFWNKYKEIYDRHQYPESITTFKIMEVIKEIKNERKDKKETN